MPFAKRSLANAANALALANVLLRMGIAAAKARPLKKKTPDLKIVSDDAITDAETPAQ